MPRWQVDGSDWETGGEAHVELEAADHADVVRSAGRVMCIRRVEQLPDPPAPLARRAPAAARVRRSRARPLFRAGALVVTRDDVTWSGTTYAARNICSVGVAR